MIHLLIRKEKEIKIHSIISHSENNNATKYLGGGGPAPLGPPLYYGPACLCVDAMLACRLCLIHIMICNGEH